MHTHVHKCYVTTVVSLFYKPLKPLSPIEQFISITVVEMSPYLSFRDKKKWISIMTFDNGKRYELIYR